MHSNILKRVFFITFLFFTYLISVEAAGKKFEIYHSFGFIDAPKEELEKYRIKEVRLYGHGHLWSGENDTIKPEPNLDEIKKRAIQSKIARDSLVSLDIEMWKTSINKPIETRITLNRFQKVIDEFRRNAPDVRFGFYGEFPKRNYWDPVRNRNGLSNQYDAWKALNKSFQPIVDKVDVVMPSLYTFYKDQVGWEVYAEENLLAAKEYGKPIFAYIWPQYTDSDLKNSEFISYEYWRKQLELVYVHANGVIIWTPKGVGHKWNPEAPWWRATIDFIVNKGLVNDDVIKE